MYFGVYNDLLKDIGGKMLLPVKLVNKDANRRTKRNKGIEVQIESKHSSNLVIARKPDEFLKK